MCGRKGGIQTSVSFSFLSRYPRIRLPKRQEGSSSSGRGTQGLLRAGLGAGPNGSGASIGGRREYNKEDLAVGIAGRVADFFPKSLARLSGRPDIPGSVR